MTIKAIATNAYRGNPTPERYEAYIESLEYDIVLMSEAQGRKLKGYRRLGAKPWARAERRDCAIFLRRPRSLNLAKRREQRFKVTNWGVHRMTDAVAGRPVQHDRHAVWAEVTHRGVDLGLIAVHLNAAIQDSSGTEIPSKGLRETEKAYDWIERKQVRWDLSGRDSIIGGDLNWRNAGWTPYKYAPLRTFRRMGMTWANRHLDWLATTLRVVARPELRQPPGADHPVVCLVMDLPE